MRQIAAVALAFAVAAGMLWTAADAVVACNTGFVEFACPDDYPTCCSWKRNGVIAACCPASSVCELTEGECLISNSSTSSNITNAPQQDGITVGVSEAAAFITFAAIGFIVGLVGCAFIGFRAFLFLTDRRTRRQEAERQALLHDDSDDDETRQNGGGDDDDSEVDDEGQCNICYSRSVNCALMPCAHVATCKVCAARLDKCPICREEVVRFVAFKTRLYRALPKPERRAGALAADTKTEELGTNRAHSSRSLASASPVGRSTVNVNDDAHDTDTRTIVSDTVRDATPTAQTTEAAAAAVVEPAAAATPVASAATSAEPEREAANGTGEHLAVVSSAAADEPTAAGTPQTSDEETA